MVVPLASCVFAWFLYDMIGDEVGKTEASWGPLLMIFSPYVIWGMFMVVNKFVKPAEGKELIDFIPTRRIESKEKKSNSSDLERRASLHEEEDCDDDGGDGREVVEQKPKPTLFPTAHSNENSSAMMNDHDNLEASHSSREVVTVHEDAPDLSRL